MDVKTFVVDEGHGVKGLADLGLQTLPQQYVQPPQERLILNKNTSVSDDDDDSSIPVIDISNWDDPDAETMICEAAEKWGFFQIVNHGIPIHVLENIKQAAHRFFGMLPEEKNNYSKTHSPSNNVQYGTSFAPHAEKVLEWKDHLSLFYVSDDEAAALWPSVCRDAALEFLKKSEVVVRKLLEVLIKGLKVVKMEESEQSILIGSKRLNMNYYPKCPQPELTNGVGPHSDVSTLTVLLQDDIGGLYIRKPGTDTWVHVPPVHGALVVNVGDALQIMSNDRYRSVEHRVVANGNRDRVSVPIFVTPKPGYVIGPFQELLKRGEKPKYKRLLYSDYAKHFFSKAHDGKATLEFAKII